MMMVKDKAKAAKSRQEKAITRYEQWCMDVRQRTRLIQNWPAPKEAIK